MKDHAQIGHELDLFHLSPVVGKGLPLLTPRGSTILRILKRFVEDEEIRRGYEYTNTPFLASDQLYRISGHWDLYRDNMFLIPDNEGKPGESFLALRPMTCPFQFQLYLRKGRSYRDLPIRYAETSYLFRNEASGALHGLIRTRQFTLSEGHIICRPDQVADEFLAALALVKYITTSIGLSGCWYRLSTRGEEVGGKYIDDPAAWEQSESLLQELLDKTGESYRIAPGEAAFYGPKLDIQYKDAWGREETLFTLQLDFALAGRFGMTYINQAGKPVPPLIIHRSSIGCYERTLALLLEHYQGQLPFWLAPEQIRLLPITELGLSAATKLREQLSEHGVRSSVDSRLESLGRRIQDAHQLMIPLMVIIGEREAVNDDVSIRLYGQKESLTMKTAVFTEWICQASRLRIVHLEVQTKPTKHTH